MLYTVPMTTEYTLRDIDLNEQTNVFIKGDARSLPIPSNSVHLIVTSPPYNANIPYNQWNDNLPQREYEIFIDDWIFESSRVLVSGGRLCVVVANVGRNPYLDNCLLYTHYAQLNGLQKRGEIIWVKKMGSANGTAWGCYDDQTRVMTKDGLKLFKDVDITSDVFATLDKNGAIEWQYAFDYIVKDYSGDMYNYKTRTTDLCVTPNHNMLYVNKYKNRLELRSADTMPVAFNIPKRTLPNLTGKYIDEYTIPSITGNKDSILYLPINVKMDDWLAFLAIVLTDGNVYDNGKNYKVSIYQKKPKYIEEIKSLLGRLPWQFVYKESKNEWYTMDKQLVKCLAEFKKGKIINFPDFIFDLSQEQKLLFIKWLWYGDGSFNADGSFWKIGIKSWDFANKLMALLSDVGMSYSVYTRKPNPRERYLNGNRINEGGDFYIINICYSNSGQIRKESLSIQSYVGKVYCVSVPNKTLLVERNGKLSWCGNSWLSANNPSLRDRHEYILVFSKEKFSRDNPDGESTITKEDFLLCSNSVWEIQPARKKDANGHPAPMPKELARRLIEFYSFKNDIVLDPFCGSGTVNYTALELGRRHIGIDLDLSYLKEEDKHD